MNPALLTFDEYYKLVNSNGKNHPESAYNTSLDKMRQESYLDKSKFPKLLKRVKIRGLMFEFRLKSELRDYVHKNNEGEYKRDTDHNLIYMSQDDIKQKGLKTHEFTIGVFNEDGDCVGAVQDEWGCVLVRVAEEYRGFGLGPMLTKIARTMEPEKPSGGFTPSGYRNFVKTYQEMVRDAFVNGFYRVLLNKKEITPARVKEILASAKLKDRAKSTRLDLNSNDPNDWLLYVGGYGDFILYDKKLKSIYKENSNHFWIEKMIKGATLVRELHDGNGVIVQFHGADDQIKKFLMSCIISYCYNEKMNLYVDPDQIQYVNRNLAKIGNNPDMKSGFKRFLVEPISAIQYAGMGKEENRFRRSFDQYDEFKNSMLETAFS